MTEQNASSNATTRDLQSRIDRAREAGVDVEISIIEADREHIMIVAPMDVIMHEGRLIVGRGEGMVEFTYAGPDALPVLPMIVPIDDAHALRAQAVSVRDAAGRVGGVPVPMRFSDCRTTVVAGSELMHVASTGIYPPTVMGLDWNEVGAVRVCDGTMTVVSSKDASAGFSMAAAA